MKVDQILISIQKDITVNVIQSPYSQINKPSPSATVSSLSSLVVSSQKIELLHATVSIMSTRHNPPMAFLPSGTPSNLVFAPCVSLRPHACRTSTTRVLRRCFPTACMSSKESTSLKSTAGWAVQQTGRTNLAAMDDDGEPLLHVVFVQPQIHWNTGNIGRTCLGLGARLHLVGPLGFSLDAKQVRRAGLDYWDHVDVRVYENWDEFANGEMSKIDGTRFFYTKFGSECATNTQWPHDGKIVLVFGSEIDGFDGIRQWLDSHGQEERTVAFPMIDEHFRSFNLSTTASMVRILKAVGDCT